MKRRDFLKGAGSLGVMSCAGWRLFAEERGLPAYYGDYLANIADNVRSQAAKGRDAFWFLTDPHVPANSKMSGFVLAKLIRETGVRKVFCGGDIPCAFGTKADVEEAMSVFREKWINPIEAAGGRLHLAKGNHDFTIREGRSERGFTLDGRLAREYILGTAAARNVVVDEANAEGAYYYLDEPTSRIRYIVADTTDSIAGTRQYWAVENGIHERQLTWLREKAFGKLPNGWSCVVIHHIPVTGVVGEPHEEKTFEGLRRLLNANSDQVVLDLTGHHHREVQTFQKGIWHVSEPSDAMFGDYISRSRPWCPNLPVKKAGTVTENTFDAVILDADDAWVRFVRVGGGADRALSTCLTVLKVGMKQRFGTSLGMAKWGCFDADKAEIKQSPTNKWSHLLVYGTDVAEITADGILLAKKPGESVVVALTSDGRKELFPVTVTA